MGQSWSVSDLLVITIAVGQAFSDLQMCLFVCDSILWSSDIWLVRPSSVSNLLVVTVALGRVFGDLRLGKSIGLFHTFSLSPLHSAECSGTSVWTIFCLFQTFSLSPLHSIEYRYFGLGKSWSVSIFLVITIALSQLRAMHVSPFDPASLRNCAGKLKPRESCRFWCWRQELVLVKRAETERGSPALASAKLAMVLVGCNCV